MVILQFEKKKERKNQIERNQQDEMLGKYIYN